MVERPSSQHLDASTIADLDAGVLDTAPTAAASAHLLTCRSCRQVRADLAEVSGLLGAATPPPMPDEVAHRIDAALAAAAAARDTSPDDSDPVVALAPRRRRWLAPLAAAAAAVVAVSIAGEVWQPTSTDDGGSIGAAQDTSAEGNGTPEAATASQQPIALVLSSESFGRDVARQLYGPAAAGSPRRVESLTAADEYAGQLCPPDRVADGHRPLRVLLDGEPAFLYLSGPRSDRLAVAVSCQDGRAIVAARTRLDLD